MTAFFIIIASGRSDEFNYPFLNGITKAPNGNHEKLVNGTHQRS